jgi:hypothetical protein
MEESTHATTKVRPLVLMHGFVVADKNWTGLVYQRV